MRLPGIFAAAAFSALAMLILSVAGCGKPDAKPASPVPEAGTRLPHTAVIYTQARSYPAGIYEPEAEFFSVYPGSFDAPQGRSQLSAWIEAEIRRLVSEKQVRAFIIAPALTGTASAVEAVRQEYPNLVIAAIEPENDLYEIEALCDFVIASDYRKLAYGAVVTAKRLGFSRILAPDYSKASKNSLSSLYGRFLERSAELEGLTLETVKFQNIDYKTETAAVLYPETTIFTGAQLAETSSSLLYLPAFPVSYRPCLDFLAKKYGEGDASYFPTNAGRLLGLVNKSLIDSNASIKFVLPGYPHELALLDAALEQLKAILKAGNYKSSNITRFVNAKSVLSALRDIDSAMGWEASNFTDPATGIRSMRTIIVSQDFYQVGKGFVSISKQRIPGVLLGP